ncbi:MAG: DMT family transporter, partial [Solobacterium sp.]|nr:DMT family transporter [Solobacterium sp.]
VQFITAAVIGLPFLFVLPVNIADIKEAAVPILYTSVMSTGVGYTFQAIGQKDNDPTSVSLILSLESVFAAVGGFLILHESFSYRELIGCILIFVAITIIQLPDRKKDCVSASQSA